MPPSHYSTMITYSATYRCNDAALPTCILRRNSLTIHQRYSVLCWWRAYRLLYLPTCNATATFPFRLFDHSLLPCISTTPHRLPPTTVTAPTVTYTPPTYLPTCGRWYNAWLPRVTMTHAHYGVTYLQRDRPTYCLPPAMLPSSPERMAYDRWRTAVWRSGRLAGRTPGRRSAGRLTVATTLK